MIKNTVFEILEDVVIDNFSNGKLFTLSNSRQLTDGIVNCLEKVSGFMEKLTIQPNSKKNKASYCKYINTHQSFLTMAPITRGCLSALFTPPSASLGKQV